MSEETLNTASGSVLSKQAIGFDIKVTWLSIARMYSPLAVKYGMTVTMGFVLLNISSEKGAAATKIAPLLGMEPRSLTRLIKNMEEQGLVTRKPDPEDKRSVRIFLTDLGLERKRIARENVDSFNQAIHSRIDPKKLETFYEVLETIHEIIPQHTVS